MFNQKSKVMYKNIENAIRNAIEEVKFERYLRNEMQETDIKVFQKLDKVQALLYKVIEQLEW